MTPRNGAFPLIVTTAVQALVSLISLAAPVMAPAVAADTGLSAARVGVFVGVVYAGACVSTLIAGDIVSRLGPIRASQMSLLLCAAGMAAATQGSGPAILLAATLIGLGYGPVTPASSHILAASTPPDRLALTFSIKQTGVPLGGMLAGLCVPWMIHLAGWRGAGAVLAVLAVGLAALTQTIRAEFDAGRNPGHPISPRRVLLPLLKVFAVPAIRDIGLCSFFFGAMQLSLTSFLVLYLTQVQGLSLALAGSILAVAQLCGVTGRLCWGWLADRWVPARLLLGLLGLASALLPRSSAPAPSAGTASSWPKSPALPRAARPAPPPAPACS